MVFAKDFLQSHQLLIAETIIIAAVRAFPGYSVARHSPQIIHHALLTYGEAATALPVERRVHSAAVTVAWRGLAAFFSVSRSICRACHDRPLCIYP